MDQRELSVARSLCRKALDADLTIEEFYAAWPQEPQGDFLSVVYDDLETGVEHTPGIGMSGNVDVSTWQRSEDYYAILIDSLLLDRDAPESLLLNLRARLFSETRIPADEAQRIIVEELSKRDLDES